MTMHTTYLGDSETWSEPLLGIYQARVAGHVFLVDGLEADEPIFVLRGHDPTSIMLLNLWSTVLEGALPDEKANGIEKIRSRFIDYWREHGDRMHLPD